MSTATNTESHTGLQTPNLWVCRILNDDFTTADFVIELLMSVFNKNAEEAIGLTMEVHDKGSAVVGTYTKDIAVTKASRAMQQAELAGHPLRTVAEQG